jgi:ABC-type lipoprotein export system ATPase subunit
VDKITLNNAVAEIFAQREDLRSDIWLNHTTFERGKIYLIEAESGTGKSSLCSYLYGQRGDYRGEIRFDERDIRRFTTAEWCRVRQQSLSILFQDLKLFGELTALENVEIKNRIAPTLTHQEIVSLFEELGIGDKLSSRINRMSYGQQQRVALVRALAQPIDFLLLDEPISHLDDRNSDIMRDIILRYSRKVGFGVITTSIGKHMTFDYDKVLKL